MNSESGVSAAANRASWSIGVHGRPHPPDHCMSAERSLPVERRDTADTLRKTVTMAAAGTKGSGRMTTRPDNVVGLPHAGNGEGSPHKDSWNRCVVEAYSQAPMSDAPPCPIAVPQKSRVPGFTPSRARSSPALTHGEEALRWTCYL